MIAVFNCHFIDTEIIESGKVFKAAVPSGKNAKDWCLAD